MSVDGWREVKLGEMVEINKNTYSLKDNWQYINYLDTGNITENKIMNIQLLDTDRDKIPSRAKRKVNNNDIIFSTVRPNHRHYGIIKKPVDNMLVSTGFAVINGKPLTVDNGFLYYYLSQHRIVDMLHTIGEHSTSAYPSIKPSDIENLNVLMPPFNEQKAIAATLSCLDDKIELNNQINKALEEMAQAIFKSWFVDFEPFKDGEFEDSELGRIPKGWRVVELKDVAKFLKGKKPKDLLIIGDSNSEQYLTIDVLNGNKPQFAEKEKMLLANEYDVLMVMDGASSGNTYFGLNGIVGSTIAKLEVNNKSMKEIVYQYLKTIESEIRSHNTGSAIPHTDKNFVLSCKLSIPSNSELNKIADIFRKIREAIIHNRAQINKLKEIRDVLLSKLMSGEVRVPIEEVQ